MFARATSIAATTAAVLSLLFQHAAATNILHCGNDIYADGFIYKNGNAADLGSFPAQDKFPLYFATTNQVGARLEYAQPARQLDTHKYQVLDSYMYINVSSGAFEPIGFVPDSNATLGAGETTYGFLTGYGIWFWYDPSKLSSDVAAAGVSHTQGFQWVPVPGGDGGVTQLYWNQTQYELAAIKGSAAVANNRDANLGMCYSDPEAVFE